MTDSCDDYEKGIKEISEKPGTYFSVKDVLKDLEDYIEKTYADKYAQSSINTEEDLLGSNGKIINCFQMKKYLARYSTEGFSKSGNATDLLKLCHYALYECVRQKRNVMKDLKESLDIQKNPLKRS